MIFVKYPEPGSVKARLAKTIGTGEAVRLYRLIAEDIIRRLKDLDEYSDMSTSHQHLLQRNTQKGEKP